MTTPDPLLERLRRLPRAALDDVAAARTLARAESAFASPPAKARAWLPRWSVPAVLASWGLLYAWGAVSELARLYPTDGAKPAMADKIDHRGPAADILSGTLIEFPNPPALVRGEQSSPAPRAGRAQFMLNAISNVSARTTTTMTIAPPLPDTLRATSRSIAVPFCSDVSSDMDPSMQVVACDTRMPNGLTFGAGRGTFAARTAARSARARQSLRARAPTEPASRRNGA